MPGANDRSRQIFENEVPVGDGIERIGRRPVETERGRRRVPVDRKGRSGQRTGPEGAFVQPCPRIPEASPVPAEHLDIGQQVMAGGHRLRRLEMRKTRHDPICMGVRLVDQSLLQAGKGGVGGIDRIAHPEAEISRHLIVARPCGMQPPRRIADPVGQPRFDIHVNVFELRPEIEFTRLDFRTDRLQSAADGSHIVAGQNPGIAQHPRMCDRSCDVLRIERLVKSDGCVNSFHKRVGRSGEPSTPHLVGPAARLRRAVEVLFVAHVSVQFHFRD